MLFYLALLSTACAMAVGNGPAHALSARDESSPKVISVDFNNHRDKAKHLRRDTQQELLANMGSDGFFIELFLGQKNDSVRIQLDTGSADFWVPADNVTCTAGADCKGYGAFDPSDSGTFKNLGTAFRVGYIDGTNATGTFGVDSVKLDSGASVDTQFAVVYQTSSNSGVLGIGPNSTEVMALSDKSKIYPTFVDTLKKEGYIKKVAYSIFLNSTTAQYGSILFGGIDHAKYSGELSNFSIANKNRISVELAQTYIGGKDLSKGSVIDGGYDVVFDTGSSISLLSSDLVNTIVQAWTATEFRFDKTAGFYRVPCVGDSSKMVLFRFKDTWIPVPIYKLIQKFNNSCYLMLSMYDPDDTTQFPLFGDDVLSQMYLVYDIEDETIGFAPVKHTTESNIVEID